MPLNPFFDFYGQTKGIPNEQNLVNNFVKEAIGINGINVYYIMRSTTNYDQILGESPGTTFQTNWQIPAYVETTQYWGGPGGMPDILAQFGAMVQEQVDLHLSRQEFLSLAGANNHSELLRPREGDLIYFPNVLDNGLWQILYVEDQKQFYPLGTRPSIHLKCELFRASGETFNTGIAVLDTAMTAFTAPQTQQDVENLMKGADNVETETEGAEYVDSGTNIADDPSDFFGNF